MMHLFQFSTIECSACRKVMTERSFTFQLDYWIIKYRKQFQIMYHQPSARKQPKKYEQLPRNSSEEKVNFIQRNKALQSNKQLKDKNTNEPSTGKMPPKSNNKTIPQKVEQLEKAVERLAKGNTHPDIQKVLLQEIQGIKSQLKQIKQQIGLSPSRQQQQPKYGQEDRDEEQQENICNMMPREYEEVRHFQSESRNLHHETKNSDYQGRSEQKIPERQSRLEGKINYNTYEKKQLLDIGKIQPYMKEFKLQNTKIPQPIYPGYHKKSSKPIVIKYCTEPDSMQNLITLYERLWKNIVKAKKVCINKIYDINEPMAQNIMALEMNKYSLSQIPLPPDQILRDVFRGIQFIHDCGYLYRDLHPTHVMQTFEGNIVLLGFRRMKRFSDIKGRLTEVKGNPADEGLHQFVSNARLRGIAEGRKDDLEAIGYIALYLLEGKLPWSINNLAGGRSKVTLQQLYGKHEKLFEYMVAVHKMNTEQQPDYDRLHNLLSF